MVSITLFLLALVAATGAEASVTPRRTILQAPTAQLLTPNFATAEKWTSIRGGGQRRQAAASVASKFSEQDATAASARSLSAVNLATFLTTVSTSMLVLLPAPVLAERLGNDRAVKILATIAACAAGAEIVLSPLLGSWIDSSGRKAALMATQAVIGAAHLATAARPGIVPVCASRAVDMLCAGFHVIITQAVIGDLTEGGDPESVGKAVGTQQALLGVGFLVGMILGGQLADRGMWATYGVSGVLALVAPVVIATRLTDTISHEDRLAFDMRTTLKKVRETPVSCGRLLFGHGKEVRVLGILLLLQYAPVYMGDVFQVFAAQEWGLTPKDMSAFLSVLGLLGVVATVLSGSLIGRMGLRHFTSLAVLSSLAFPVGTMFSYRAAFALGAVGFLSAAQTVGITSLLMVRGSKSGVPQGELAGERASMTAILKIAGPLLYSWLYLVGQDNGLPNLPFLFNIGLGIIAVVLCQTNL